MEACQVAAIKLDWATFNPWHPQPFRHRMAGHPLLQPDQLSALAKRFEMQAPCQIFTFNNSATAATNFDAVSRLHPNRKHADDTIMQILAANAWIDLRHVQTDSAYRSPIDAVLDPMMQCWIR